MSNDEQYNLCERALAKIEVLELTVRRAIKRVARGGSLNAYEMALFRAIGVLKEPNNNDR